MNGVLLLCTGLIVLFRAIAFPRTWNRPLAHGPGFFFSIEVAPGFYEGSGAIWLKRYRMIVIAELMLEALALAAILFSGRWVLFPVWAGGCAALFVSTFLGFTAWARHKLGPDALVQSRVAVSLERRRVRDYIWWPAEALTAALIAFSFALLLTNGDANVRWQVPVVLTYTIVGLLAAKIRLVQSSFPLPADRTQEHYAWVEMQRRQALGLLVRTNRFLICVLAGYAVLHGWAPVASIPWFRWLVIGLALALWLVMMCSTVIGERDLAEGGRNLRPTCGWPGAFRGTALMTKSGWLWSAAYATGLVLLLVFFRR